LSSFTCCLSHHHTTLCRLSPSPTKPPTALSSITVRPILRPSGYRFSPELATAPAATLFARRPARLTICLVLSGQASPCPPEEMELATIDQLLPAGSLAIGTLALPLGHLVQALLDVLELAAEGFDVGVGAARRRAWFGRRLGPFASRAEGQEHAHRLLEHLGVAAHLVADRVKGTGSERAGHLAAQLLLLAHQRIDGEVEV